MRPAAGPLAAGVPALVALVVVLVATVPGGAEESRPDPARVAVVASLDVEQALLEEDRLEYSRLTRRRSSVATRIAQLRSALDGAITNRDVRAAELIQRISSQLEQAEGERAELQISARVLVDRIRDRLRRIVLFEDRVALLDTREPAARGPLDGKWEIVLLPIDQNGTFRLEQNGTIVSGTYTLSGGFSGSLRGTFVKTKLFLERIDSRLGRMMEFEGRLSGDQTQILGTWQSYELAEGEGANGQWSATRPRE